MLQTVMPTPAPKPLVERILERGLVTQAELDDTRVIDGTAYLRWLETGEGPEPTPWAEEERQEAAEAARDSGR